MRVCHTCSLPSVTVHVVRLVEHRQVRRTPLEAGRPARAARVKAVRSKSKICVLRKAGARLPRRPPRAGKDPCPSDCFRRVVETPSTSHAARDDASRQRHPRVISGQRGELSGKGRGEVNLAGVRWRFKRVSFVNEPRESFQKGARTHATQQWRCATCAARLPTPPGNAAAAHRWSTPGDR